MKFKKLEEKLNYKFNDQSLLVQTMSHKSYTEIITKVHKITMYDYNTLEFLGDKLLDFFVLDFFYKNSANYKHLYGSKALHKLKSEIVNNDFLSLVAIENRFHEFILFEESSQLKEVLDPYIKDVKEEFKLHPTKKIYEQLIDSNP